MACYLHSRWQVNIERYHSSKRSTIMWRRKYFYRAAPAEHRREVYKETLVDDTGKPIARTVVTDVEQEPVVQPVAAPVYVPAPRRAVVWLRDGAGAKQLLWYVVSLVNTLLVVRFVL